MNYELNLHGDVGLEEVIEIDDHEEVIDVDNGENQLISTDADHPEKEARRRRRRRLRRLLGPGVTPSFIAIISPDNGEEDYDDPPPKRFRIDVDDYLGLTHDKPPRLAPVDSSLSVARKSVLPSEEGYFEGSVSFALPEDSQHLYELHLLIRQQLEMFSASEDDVLMTQAGRRTRTVRGKVGIRCVHCTKAFLNMPVQTRTWPPGAISYPVNIAGFYPVCSQKPQLHFENCPNMPQEIKGQLHRLTNEPTLRRQKSSDTNSISASLYYAISAKRIGLIDVDGGIRFGRDLKLEPLSLESVKVQVESNLERFTRKGSGAVLLKPPENIELSQARITADEESERVLARLFAEKDDAQILGRSDDKRLVSDCIFICVRSMAICHAVPSDFESRGKKTKLMRIGLAGFCCRYCNAVNTSEATTVPIDFSCRSFSSHPDNLSSAISNSFFLHLQKCFRAPLEIRKALAAFKRLHTRQMAKLPFGAQRKLFYALWARLRANDLSKEVILQRIKDLPQSLPETIPSTAGVVDVAHAIASSPISFPDVVPSIHIEGEDEERPTFFPFCDDEETKATIYRAREQDPAINDGLILSSDEYLVTEFVFLMMKQLKVAHPTPLDFARGKRTTVLHVGLAGMCCMHCDEHDHASAGGRSFPSAPDNMASSLNTSLYQHMQRCLFLPDDIKRALATVKKVHSHQCANLKFGSQRRYFNLVFQRLQSVETHVDMREIARVKAEQIEGMGSRESEQGVNSETLAKFNFHEVSKTCFECLRCRMVPMAFRVANSVGTNMPSWDFMESHSKFCKEDALDLSNIVAVIEECLSSISGLSLEKLEHPNFLKVVRTAVGDDIKLVQLFTKSAFGLIKQRENAARSEGMEGINDPDVMNGICRSFPTIVNIGTLVQEFHEFAETVPGMEPLLSRNALFLRLFQMISPFLVVTMD